MVDFDETQQDEMSITVTACDPDPDHCEDVDITFRVYDVNDNAPVFNPDFVDVSMAEDVSVGTFVAAFTATDDDTLPINHNFT